jgi:hypothetical protein
MRASMAYFAGAGTIVVAIAAGLGGGLTIASVMAPHQEKLEQTKLEQRMSARPIPASAQADQAKQQAEQARPAIPYIAATNGAISANTPTAPVQPQSQTQSAVPASQPLSEPAKLAGDPPAKPAEAQTAKPQAVPREQAISSPEDANAKARDTDLKRLAAEKRKADRRQQWADRKKAQQQRDAELRDVEESVRRDPDEPRIVQRDFDGPRIVVRQDDDDSDRRSDFGRRRDRPFGLPMFNLFGGERE